MQTTEKVKKKRGRKPKSFYLQQQMEQEKMASEQMEKRKLEMQEAENEEEVKLRQDEYRSHPLFGKMQTYAEELKEYIEEKRRVQQLRQAEMQKEQERKEQQVIFSVYPDIKGGNIFQTQKVLNNNSNLKKDEEKKEDATHEDEDEAKHREEEELKEKERQEELSKDERYRLFTLMSEEDKDAMTCDEIFSLYLRHVSKHVNENYYRTTLKFILLYRECLNEYGWLKRREHFDKTGLLD